MFLEEGQKLCITSIPASSQPIIKINKSDGQITQNHQSQTSNVFIGYTFIGFILLKFLSIPLRTPLSTTSTQPHCATRGIDQVGRSHLKVYDSLKPEQDKKRRIKTCVLSSIRCILREELTCASSRRNGNLPEISAQVNNLYESPCTTATAP